MIGRDCIDCCVMAQLPVGDTISRLVGLGSLQKQSEQELGTKLASSIPS